MTVSEMLKTLQELEKQGKGEYRIGVNDHRGFVATAIKTHTIDHWKTIHIAPY